jgi:hypothetical protein
MAEVNRRRSFFWLLLLLLLIALLVSWCRLYPPAGTARPPVVFQDASGVERTEFQLHDSVMIDVVGLEPSTGYQVEIVDETGAVVVSNRLSTDRLGAIPPTVLWYAVGLRPCAEETGLEREATPVPYSRVVNASIAGRAYALNILREGVLVRSAEFRVAAGLLRPTLYAADRRGCPKTGFLIGEEDVFVVGRNFPEGSLIRLWAVPADADWRDGEPLEDQTQQHGYELPPIFELRGGDRHFRRLLWPAGLTSVGSYDLVAEVVNYPFGTYRENPQAKVLDVVASRVQSGFVIQRRPGEAEPLAMDIAGVRQSPFTFRSAFLTTENVYVGVDPLLQPSYVGQTADVYIVSDRTDAQWTTNTNLTGDDVTGTVEQITVNGICGNCWNTLAWTAPLTTGEYDIVLDFNQNGAYDAGVDLIDGLDPAGFTVSEIRIEAISFNHPAAGAVTLYDHTAGNTVSAPEYLSAGQVVKPAAWVRGGSPTVQVSFVAVPAVTTAEIWAEGGVGGLATGTSPVTVPFAGGTAQASFPVGSPPTTVAKSTFQWDWKYRIGGSTAEMGSTGEHLVYTVLAAPQAPQTIPWVEALDVAVTAAQGETTPLGAARAVWDEFYNNAGGLYDVALGSSAYTTNGEGSDFNLTLWLSHYAAGNIGTVNCYDMGKSVLVFANALGCGAEYTYVSPFGYLNLVHPIGRGWANNPFYNYPVPGYSSDPIVPGDWSSADGRTSFGNHGFTRVAGQILDASGGQVDIDGDPDGSPVTAWDLDGDDTWPASYQSRVIDNIPASTPGAPVNHTFGVY